MTEQYPLSHPIRAREPHGCFGCGELNEAGLHLQFYALPDNGGVWAPWEPTTSFEGYGGVVHGGIVSTVLDEIMAWALYQRACWAVTASIQVRFRKPVQVGEAVRLVGTVVRDRGRLFDVHGEVRRASDGVVLAEAEGVFMRVPPAQSAAWEAEYGIVLEAD